MRSALILSLCLLPALLSSQGERAADDAARNAGPYDVLVRVEWIEVPHETLTALMADPALRSGTRLRTRLQELVRAKEASIWDTAMVSHRAGARGKAESQREWIFPTEAELSFPPGPLGVIPPSPNHFLQAYVPVTPTAFETRNVGEELEVEAVRQGEDSPVIELSISAGQSNLLELVEHKGRKTPSGNVDSFKTPLIETLSTAQGVAVVDGQYSLLGIVRRKAAPGQRLLVMVRCDVLD